MFSALADLAINDSNSKVHILKIATYRGNDCRAQLKDKNRIIRTFWRTNLEPGRKYDAATLESTMPRAARKGNDGRYKNRQQAKQFFQNNQN
jgi:hypothetical protein